MFENTSGCEHCCIACIFPCVGYTIVAGRPSDAKANDHYFYNFYLASVASVFPPAYSLLMYHFRRSYVADDDETKCASCICATCFTCCTIKTALDLHQPKQTASHLPVSSPIVARMTRKSATNSKLSIL